MSSRHLGLPTDPNDYDKMDFPFFRQPVILGDFSLNGKQENLNKYKTLYALEGLREFRKDRSEMMYFLDFKEDKVNFDLNEVRVYLE